MHYRAPALAARRQPADHLAGAVRARAIAGRAPRYRRERWTTPDGDFVDVDWLRRHAVDRAADAPLLVLFHGLEGSSRSHYAEAFADFARARGWAFAVPHFRGCSGELNLAPRAYHSGDFEEIDWILRALARARMPGRCVAVGVSLGGNALMRWAGEVGERGRAAWSARWPRSARRSTWRPAAAAIGRGFNRLVYTRMFLRTMKPKALAKLAQHPGLFDREALLAARDLYAFDNVFTAPLHGFRDTDDYWARASAKPHLQRIRMPALALNALQRPVRAGRQPAAGRPRSARTSRCGSRRTAGTSAFRRRRFPGHVRAMPEARGRLAAAHLHAAMTATRRAEISAMDDIVRQALAKWPNVPHCYGWLGPGRARQLVHARRPRRRPPGPLPAAAAARARCSSTTS